MMDKTVLTLGTVNHIQSKLDGLKECGYNLVQLTAAGMERPELLEALARIAKEHCVVVIIIFNPPGPWGRLDEEFFSRFAPHIKLVAGPGAGFDKVDVDYLARHGAYYANSPFAVADPTATTTIMLMLQVIRNATQADANTRASQWTAGLGFTPKIKGMLVGIIGMGTIGKLVRDKAMALGMKVIYSNRRRLPAEEEGGATFVTSEELLKQARLITLHCPLNDETYHLLSDDQFAQMRDGVLIVNTSRGPVIDEEALVRAMESGKVLRCGLDVFEHEPQVHPWLQSSKRATLLPVSVVFLIASLDRLIHPSALDNTHATRPGRSGLKHYAAWVEGIFEDIENEMFDNVTAWIENGVPNTPVNKPQ
ncbi:hypothetical protein CPB86DRAFT_822813 [Serendipita vermifera]|nr:hypothetical protein CPB86DRAFT_822813 [Serendipita vermifera]